MSNAGPLETLARVTGDALSPLAESLQGDGAEQIVESLGLRLPGGVLTSAGITQALSSSATACARLPDALAALVDAIDGNDDAALLRAAVSMGEAIAQATTAFAQLGSALDAGIQGAAGLTPAQRTRLEGIARDLPAALMHLAVISYVRDGHPTLADGLGLTGIFDDVAVPGDPADPTVPPHRQRRIRFDRLAPLFGDPIQYLKDLYGFGRPDFDGIELFTRVKRLVDRPDAEALLITAPGQPAILEALIFRLAIAPGPVPGLRIRIRQQAAKDLADLAVPVGGPWSVIASSHGRFDAGIELLLDPVAGLRIEPPEAAASIDFAVGLRAAHADGSPLILIGQAGKSRIELKSLAVRMPIALQANAAAASANLDLGAAVELAGGRLVIDASTADGFIATLLGGLRIDAPFDVGATFDRSGLRFSGSATMEIAIPSHLTLGPVSIPTLYVIAGFKDGALPVEFSADIGAELGPLTATVNRLGAIATVRFPANGGNAGPIDIAVTFKGPTGVGLAVNAGAVRGGGFLSIDSERGEYAGLLELDLAGIVTVKAIGLISTRMPDGSPGFSLLIVITAEFGTGLQLGFGFTLLAVGGILGLNRTMNLTALAEGVRSNGISSVMFPRDIVANAARIISDLRAFFPVREGTFLIGPMIKLGWGTPTLVSISVGVIIEIPGNIAIVGVLRVALPADELAIIVLQVNFIGAIEFDKKRFWFFASLYDSRILFLTIEGEVGVLAAFGDDANLVLTVGGFHPSFDPPALPFPSPRRIAVDVLNSPTGKLRVEAYFAVTSNTAQFGARVDAQLGFDDFGIKGYLAFDALLQFSPFHFIIQISAGLSLQAFGVGLFSISLRLQLEGVSPWRAKGTGSISLLFFDIDVDFDITWGESRPTTLPPIAVMPLIKAEFEKAQNWHAMLPPGNNLLVSLRKLDPVVNTLVLHPVGTLRVSQRAIPLDLTFTKVGNQAPTDAKRLAVAITSAGLAIKAPVDESFAPAQFQDLADADRLSRPAFQPMHGGVDLSVSGEQLSSGAMVKRIIRYELTTIDSAFRSHQRFVLLPILLLNLFLDGAAVARSVLSQHVAKQLVPFKEVVTIAPEAFVVASQVDNKPVAVFTSEAMAREHLTILLAAEPAKVVTLHVIPGFEAAA